MGLKILSICLRTYVLQLLRFLRGVKGPLPFVLCEESPYDLIDVVGPFQSFCKHEIFTKLNLPSFLEPVNNQKNQENNFDHSNL